MGDRKVELEQKKAQLEELRRSRMQRQQISSAVTPTPINTDELLHNIGLDLPAPSQHIMRAETVAVSPSVHSPRRARKLQLSKINETSCPPSERITYARETQTTEVLPQSSGRNTGYYVLTYDDNNRNEESELQETHAELDKLAHINNLINEAEKEEDIDELQKEILRIKENTFTEEEKNIIMSSENFKSFFDRYSRIIERAVCETDVDILTDYSGNADLAAELDQERRNRLVKLSREFYDDHWSRRRVVTSLNWSELFPELLLASYHSNEDAPHEPDGVCLLWNLKYRKDTPEYVLHCQSPLMSACLPNFHPNLVLGGTYSGQIVLWDIRSNKRTPVQRTPLNASCHTHPINKMAIVGSQNAHNLISISADGKMCCWSLDMLSAPSETLEMQKQAKAIALTSMDFVANDINNFAVGSEDGSMYFGIRHGERQGVGQPYEGHLGPISGLSCHKVPGQVEFNNLVLTSSFDWTVKLWSSQESGHRHLHSFEDAGDYIYDVAWSPVHPSVFASVDGESNLALWDLTIDTEVPVSKLNVANSLLSSSGSGSSTGALNKASWHSNGVNLAVGDDCGRVSIMEVGESLYTPSTNSWTDMTRALADIQMNNAELNRDNAV